MAEQPPKSPMSPRVHRLKTHEAFFTPLATELKMFEVRRDDRGYAVNDVLILEEWVPGSERYTGSFVVRRVMYKLDGGQFGIEPGFCVLGLEPYALVHGVEARHAG